MHLSKEVGMAKFKVQVLIWPDSVNERIVEYVEEQKIDPSRIEIISRNHIVIHNEENHDA
jgi:hypothetical protein